jgi:hypothetical protein
MSRNFTVRLPDDAAKDAEAFARAEGKSLNYSAVAVTRPHSRRHVRWFERLARVVPKASAISAG